MDWLMPLCMLGVFVAAVLGAYGYRGREEQIVGIDLGTTFSVVAVKRRDGIEVVRDHITGDSILPSAVSFLQNGTVLVGPDAQPYRSSDPDRTIYNAKRFIGRPYDDVAQSQDLLDHPFRVVNGTDLPKVKGRLSGARFAVDVKGSDVLYSPEEVGSHIVKRLSQSVETRLGWPISRAVICVPAKFSGPQRRSTQHAFELAGIKVMRVMDEPTAAAVAYNLDTTSDARNILVYDIGGGTLDVSLLFMNGDSIKTGKASRGSITVLGSEGDDHLGGADFDELMASLLSEKIAAEKHVAGGTCAGAPLLVQGERMKKELSSAESADFDCEDGAGAKMRISVSRTEYEERCKPLYDRALNPVKKILENSLMTPRNVHHVVLVGGASRMPRLRELLKRYFAEDGEEFAPPGKIRHDIDPDVTVAFGAANIVD